MEFRDWLVGQMKRDDEVGEFARWCWGPMTQTPSNKGYEYLRTSRAVSYAEWLDVKRIARLSR